MISLEEVKQQLNIDLANTEHDDELQDYIDAVTSVVERQTGEVVELRTIEEHHDVSAARTLLLRSVPVSSLTSVERVDGSQTWSVGDLYVNEQLGEVTVLSGSLFDGLLKVTFEAGYDVAPANYNLAARIIVQHLWKTQRGVAGAPFAGGMATSLGEGGTGFAVPRRAAELLGSPMPGVA